MFVVDEDIFRLIGASGALLNALDGLMECFDSEGVFHAPDNIAELWDNGRAAVEQAVDPELFKECPYGGK